ncbi:ribosomal RNA large subunit methyltransferase [Tubulinosema ratisbonensis]|uniref:Ribosomal RNA large subunit methyltransferase n=1 Tax=Tubulinosema ratisbonensis TaxID=291195 RepID=A0A437AN31_9MICR|nr:ribosomal RNA large subunit methyltransferase [Tubulinosema ratisbonensis]
MASRKKIGKNRLDKFYHKAKELGYRARSAFKLIHLNTKYNFLEGVTAAIDLCAAPGGWLQVLAKHNIETIIGVDLDSIKPIPNVITFKSDITTDTCRKELVRILGDKKVELILHDGAPNVGTAWEQDAYAQNELVLHSLRLASEFLCDGGNFVTKIFRSKDYCALLSVFNEIFEEVDATKPLSSREESAEIFVYCHKFISEKVRNDLFNPEKVFKEENELEDFNKVKKFTLTDFFNSNTPLEDLTNFDKLNYKEEEKELKENLTEELKIQFSDLKLISEAEKRKILRWRNKIILKLQNEEIKLENFIFRIKADKNFEVKLLTDEQKLEKIEEEMLKIEKKERKKEKKERKEKKIDLPAMNFFKDKIFDAYYKEKEEKEVIVSQEEEVFSCSDSLELEEEEIRCAIRLKENEEEFIEETIDKYCTNDTSKLPKKIVEEDFKDQKRRILRNKKEEEALLRRRKKADRLTRRALERKEEQENEEDLEDAARKIRRSSFKRTKNKPRVVIVKQKGGRVKIPKGKGRVVFIDRRMKKDKRKIKK